MPAHNKQLLSWTNNEGIRPQDPPINQAVELSSLFRNCSPRGTWSPHRFFRGNSNANSKAWTCASVREYHHKRLRPPGEAWGPGVPPGCCSSWSIMWDGACPAPGTAGGGRATGPSSPAPPAQSDACALEASLNYRSEIIGEQILPQCSFRSIFWAAAWPIWWQPEVGGHLPVDNGTRSVGGRVSNLPCHCSARFVCWLSMSVTKLIRFSSLGAFCWDRNPPFLPMGNSYF